MTTLTVKVNGVPINATRAELNFLGLTTGHSLATILSENTTVEPNDSIEVYNNGILMFNGFADSDILTTTSDRQYSGEHNKRISARDLSMEYSNLKVTKIYEDPIKADDLIEDLMFEAGCEIVSFESDGLAPELNGFAAIDEYLLTLIKRILEQVGWEGFVDTSGILHLFEAADPPASELALTAGQRIERRYYKDGLGIRNDITIRGAALSFDPANKDACESYDGWTCRIGDFIYVFGNPPAGVIGSYCVGAHGALGEWVGRVVKFYYSKEFIVGLFDEYKKIHFVVAVNTEDDLIVCRIQICAPDEDNCFYIDIDAKDDSWTVIEESLGVDNEYIPEENETGWKTTGSPSWNKVKEIQFLAQWDTEASPRDLYVDGLYLSPKRWVYSTTSPISIDLYGKRKLSLTVESLLTQQQTQDYCIQQRELYKDKIRAWEQVVPAELLIVNDEWKALIGYKYGTHPYYERITSTTVTCQPYENLKDGHDFICKLITAPLLDRYKTWLYDITLNPQYLKFYAPRAKL